MAWPLPRHSSLIFLITIVLIRDSSEQQNGQLNQLNSNNPLGPSLQNGLNIQKNLNQNTKCPIHQTNILNEQQSGKLPVNLQQKLLQQAAAQQQFILQQQASNSQNTNLPTSFSHGPNVQQQLHQPSYLQQPIQNFQQLQQQHLPQYNFQQLNLQPQGSFQQQNVPSTLTSLQLANTPRSETSFTSPPITNLPLSGLNLQMLQQISDPGIMSPTSPSSSYPFNIHSNIETLPGSYSQNQQIPFANIPSSVIDILQTTNPLSQIPDSDTINNQQQSFALIAVPLQNQQTNVATDSQTHLSGFPNQVTIVKPLQPFTSMGPSKRQELDKSQLSLLSSLLSEPQSSQISSLMSTLYGNPLLTALSKQGPKSSNLKTILPLIFNLLKEKNTGCPCQTCGRMNNNKEEPQIFSGYANQNNYGYYEGKSQNNNVSYNDTKLSIPQNKRKYENHNKINTDSSEYESDHEYIDSYEDEASKEEVP